MDLPNKEHNRNNLSIKDTSLIKVPNVHLPTNTFLTSKKRTTFLQRTKWLVPLF